MCNYAVMKPDVNHDQRTAATLTKGLGAAGAAFCMTASGRPCFGFDRMTGKGVQAIPNRLETKK